MIGAMIGRLTIQNCICITDLQDDHHGSLQIGFNLKFREGFGIHIDDVNDKYGPHSKAKADANTMTDELKCLNLLKHYLIQLHWWFNAMFVH